MIKNKIGISMAYFTIVMLLFSCSSERELAKEYLKKGNGIPILFNCTNKLILSNDKLKRINNFDSLNIQTQDSLWTANTLYLDSVKDSILIMNLSSNLQSRLQQYGFKVYNQDSITAFKALETTKYTFTIAQIDLVEDSFKYRDEEVFNNLIYYQDSYLNSISLNLWFEFSSSGNKTEKVFYNSSYINDILESKFLINSQDYSVSYKYKITPIQSDDIYSLSAITGQRNAGYLFNYLMNQYIIENFPQNNGTPKFFVYDIKTGFLYQDNNDNFTEINP